MTDKNITFTPETRDLLRGAYMKAVDDGNDVFTFNGDEYVTGYAKYLLEFLDTQLVETSQ